MYRITFDCSGDRYGNGRCQIDVNADAPEEAKDKFLEEIQHSKEFKQEYGNLYKLLRIEELPVVKQFY